MKRQKRKATPKKTPATTTAAQPTSSHKTVVNRRQFLETLGYGAIGVGIVGGGAWYFVSSVQAGFDERDLSRLGNGIPAVVQIHDPQCPRCRALQREAREAISAFADGSIQFLVANIREPEGQQFAALHGVGHITLVLFDGQGQRRRVLVGENRSDYLVSEFRHLVRRAGS